MLLDLSDEEYDWLYANGTSSHFAEIDKLYSLLSVDSPNGQCADCGRVLAEQAIVALFMDETITASSSSEIGLIDNFFGSLNCTNLDLYGFFYNKPNSLVKGAFAKVILSGAVTSDLTDIAEKIELFYFDNHYTPTSTLNDFQFNALEMIASDNSFVYDRFSDLFTFMKNNPNGLLENCVSSNPKLNWSDYYNLLNFTPPQACLNRLFFLNINYSEDYGIQVFEDANSNLTNLDYYAVEISTFPEKYPGGPIMTKPELFEFIRENFLDVSYGYFTDFVSSCDEPPTDISEEFMFYSDKYFFTDATHDSELWASPNPLTTMFFIDAWAEDILPSIVADNGSVITSQFTENCCWIFTTIKTEASGSQPFSGHRQFGFKLNDQNKWEFYAKAIDRANVLPIMRVFRPNACLEEDYYNIGHLTWSNLQSKLAELVNTNGGEAIIKNPVYEHLETTLVLELLRSDTPVDFVGCE